MTDPIRGRIAKILNVREAAINIGSKQGVRLGMIFDVVDDKHRDITDPETNQVLGSIERSKTRLKVTHVQENLCVASTLKKRRVNIGRPGTLYDALMPKKWIAEYEILMRSDMNLEDDERGYVNVGDPVVLICENLEETSGQAAALSN